MHGLQLPRPAQPSTLPPLPPADPSPSSSSSLPRSSSSSAAAPPPRQPPRNYADQRAHARQLRHDRVKSPFIARGKDRDLSQLSGDQLAHMLDRTVRLLDSPDTVASLPGGDARLRAQRDRIERRLRELDQVQRIREGLDKTRITDDDPATADGDDVKVKTEEDDGEGHAGPKEMQDLVQSGASDEASSPSAKRRIAAQALSRSPKSLIASLSLADSLALQRRAVALDRQSAERKARKAALDEHRPEKTGELLRGALGVDSALSGFMFHAESDEEPDEAEIDDWLNEGRRGANGELDDEESAQLNPLRTAYMEGWDRAEAEG
ncbi:hypothetical protein Rhopal_004816-T1 [Rhodotorula paludigena]|uniref:Uncharacterized protein n=1 Tax=Rhodotorula paludigena TaxID=86838 RepID=A0AAV5GT35_9BASI|nr:hypothetical protein Rhopal_004816-T1 [Rhodotorula paludigena]